MRVRNKLGVLAVAALGVMVAGPQVAAGDVQVSDAGRSSASAGDRDGSRSLRVVGLAGGGTSLVKFETDRPGKVRDRETVRGLTSGDRRLIGIDYRVQDGRLYGVGNNAAAAGVYRIDPSSGRAQLVGRLSAALSGTRFGVDFNPAANALRVISDTGQNLRQSFATTPFAPTVVDAPLTYTPGTTATGVNGAAYTNNDLDPDTATTLFDVDTSLDQVAIQSPANAGTLAATGSLGVDAGGDAGFDIYSTLRRGTTVDVQGFAVLNRRLFEVSLLTGAASPRGRIGGQVTDLAIPLNQR